MAINLWKLQKPISYNPLPTGWNTSITLPAGDYTIVVSGYSPTSAALKLDVAGTSTDIKNLDTGVSGFITLALSPVVKTFEVNFRLIKGYAFYLYDNLSVGNIVITDVKLVQKPLPKLTINGIDGFKSGKWTFSGSFNVMSDDTLDLGMSSLNTASLVIPAFPSQNYVLNVPPNEGWINIFSLDGNNNSSMLKSLPRKTSGAISLSTLNNTKTIRIQLQGDSAGLTIFSQLMLNLGTIPAPYSKKTGDKMVMPVPKGNLFDGNYDLAFIPASSTAESLTSDTTTRTTKWMPCKANVNYTKLGGNRALWQFKNTSGVITFQSDASGTLISTKQAPSDGWFRVYYSGVSEHERNIVITDKPYAVQVNKKPMRWVAKKNYMPIPDAVRYNEVGQSPLNTVVNGKLGVFAYDYAHSGRGVMLNVTPNVKYTFSCFIEANAEGRTGAISIGSVINSGNIYLNLNKVGFISATFTPTTNVIYVQFIASNGTTALISPVLFSEIQLEEGTTATPYEPYQLILPKAKKGLAFNGVTDYLQLPSMTMDSIEIDCLIDGVQNGGTQVVFSNVLFSEYQLLAWQSNPRNIRTKMKFNVNSTRLSKLNIFSNESGAQNLKATLYKVTCYLAGNIVAQYDFENPQNIVGDKVLQQAKNLIPSFEDARWSLHANAKVLGKDVLRLEASGIEQASYLWIDVSPNTKYKMSINGVFTGNQRIRVGHTGIDPKTNTYLSAITKGTGYDVEFIVPNGITKISFLLDNSTSTGTFDFIKPSLYQLDSKEATLIGAPTKARKTSKRTFERKR